MHRFVPCSGPFAVFLPFGCGGINIGSMVTDRDEESSVSPGAAEPELSNGGQQKTKINSIVFWVLHQLLCSWPQKQMLAMSSWSMNLS